MYFLYLFKNLFLWKKKFFSFNPAADGRPQVRGAALGVREPHF